MRTMQEVLAYHRNMSGEEGLLRSLEGGGPLAPGKDRVCSQACDRGSSPKLLSAQAEPRGKVDWEGLK
jgi:hypothetical protein